MSVEILTILMFLTLMATIALGHPLAVTLAAVATVFGLIDNGFDVPGLLGLFANNAWGIFLNYTLVAIPLFIFMAQILDRSKVSEGLFDALYIVLGGLRGGLGLAVIVVSTVFAATTGIVGASVVAMGLMAGPALLRRGYDTALSAGIICSSGTLGILIPPSIMLVVYGGLTGQKETSVGNLFAAAILPGLLLSGLYLLYVGIRCYLNPKMGPPIPAEDRTATVGQKIAMTMKNFVPPFGLILTVMGTILAGIATPTEAAALGCVGALILALVGRKLTWEVITQASISTARTTAMIMALFIGGKFFSVVFLSMGGGDVVSDVLLGMEVSPYVVFLIMMTVVFFMGMFIDWAGDPVGGGTDFHADRHGSRFQPTVVRHDGLHQPANLFFDPAVRLLPVLLQRSGAAGIHYGNHLQRDYSLCCAADHSSGDNGLFPRDHYLPAECFLRQLVAIRKH